MSGQPKPESIDYDGLMQANLERVFGEDSPDKRLEAIRELYAEDAVLNEPHDSVKGHTAINEAVTALLGSLPPGFVFRSVGSAVGHHNVGRLKWRSGRPDGLPVVTGMDVAHFVGNRIHSLYVFLEPPAEA
jgi:hypothetical protein